MAHFAKINEQNQVLGVHVVNDSDATTEAAGQAFLESIHNWPANLWIQTSYNTHENTHATGGTAFRGNYAGAGYTWDSTNSIFWPPKPYASWTKDITNAKWQSPLGEKPSLTSEEQSQNQANTHGWIYEWDEDAYQADNSTGWVLTNTRA